MFSQEEAKEQNSDEQNQEINEQERNSLFNSLSAQLSDYIISHPIGSGAGSLVVKVKSIKTKKEYAIKVVDKQSQYYKSAYKRLKNEIEIHLDLKHKNIVKMIKSFEDSENLYLVMEYCEGGDLFHYLKHHKKLSETEAKRITYKLAEGLKYLHDKSIIHRDLKLGNVLLSSDHQVKICDFGLAVRLNGNEQEKNTICGTPNYISPEILNKQPYGMKIDCWSFGCILYALIVGHPPFQGQDIVQTLKKVTSQEQFFELPNNISDNLKDLLVNIINWNQDSRFTIDQILMHPFYEEMRQKSVKQRQEEEESLSFFNSIRSVKGEDQRINVHQNGVKKIDIKYQDNFFNQLEHKEGSMPKKSNSPTNIHERKNQMIYKNDQIAALKNNKIQNEDLNIMSNNLNQIQYKKQSQNNLVKQNDKQILNQKEINFARKNSPVDRFDVENQQNNMNKQKDDASHTVKVKEIHSHNQQLNIRKQSPTNQILNYDKDKIAIPERKSLTQQSQAINQNDVFKSPKLTSNQQEIKQTFINNIEKIKSNQPPVPQNQQQQNNSAITTYGGQEKRGVKSIVYNNSNNQNNINTNQNSNQYNIQNSITNNQINPTNNYKTVNSSNINNNYYSNTSQSQQFINGINHQHDIHSRTAANSNHDKYIKNTNNIRNNSPVNNNSYIERNQSPNTQNNHMSSSSVLNNGQQQSQHKNNSYSISQSKVIPLPKKVQTSFLQNLNSLTDVDRFSPPHNNTNSTNTTTNNYVNIQSEINNFPQPQTVSHNRTKNQVSFENKPIQAQVQNQTTQKVMQSSDQGFYKKNNNPPQSVQTNLQRNQSPQLHVGNKNTSDNLNYYLTKKDHPQCVEDQADKYEEIIHQRKNENKIINRENNIKRISSEQNISRVSTEYKNGSNDFNTQNKLNNQYNNNKINIDYTSNQLMNNNQQYKINQEYNQNKLSNDFSSNNNKMNNNYVSNKINTEYNTNKMINHDNPNRMSNEINKSNVDHYSNKNNSDFNKINVDYNSNKINYDPNKANIDYSSNNKINIEFNSNNKINNGYVSNKVTSEVNKYNYESNHNKYGNEQNQYKIKYEFSSPKMNTEQNTSRLNTDYKGTRLNTDFNNTRDNTECNTQRLNTEQNTARLTTEQYNPQRVISKNKAIMFSMDNLQGKLNMENANNRISVEQNINGRFNNEIMKTNNENLILKNGNAQNILNTNAHPKIIDKKQKSEVPLISQIANQPMRSSQVQLTQQQQQQNIPITFLNEDRDLYKKQEKFDKVKHFKNQTSDNANYSLNNTNNINGSNEYNKEFFNAQYQQQLQDQQEKMMNSKVNTYRNSQIFESQVGTQRVQQYSVQAVKSKSRIQSGLKTDVSDSETNSISNQNSTTNNLEYYESPRINTLNLMLSPERRIPTTNNSTAVKNNSQMKNLLSGNKDNSSCKNNSNNTSKYSRLSPLKVGRIPPSKITTQNGTIEITEGREFILQSIQKNITMVISPDGRDVTLIKQEEPLNKRQYTIDRLPEKYVQFYDYCKKICQTLQKNAQDKSAKVKLENEDGQFYLYENKFEGVFSNGFIVNYKLNSQNLEIQTNKYAPKIVFDLQKDLKHASKEMKTIVQKTQKIISIITSMKS
ncbi:Serine/Threonine kinase domain protein (macronuclear) [Tetrahymena thermophila SB210]|uniref:Serine/Threonine kinase domain protein n=1 Tax=Tetrahymena thermophila (strain SB210) TaxID=312017 RepID=Q23ML0_TETTS|nr:Serine/Threonine kinase domain protein [Tetrahymena thermophila SB210]EAR97756.2 Serine/Threonine kinase domain protein [Tetrahymena thermophila SB210]|eukprot:XP_001018001.2 Serine/Threonine kinase domain protein [Tetrahymena thermophila SB210]